jgi:hypothetical protein
MKRSLYFQGTIAVLLFMVLISCHSKNESYIIGLNQNIHHDDFEYSVTSYQITSGLSGVSDNSAPGNGNYYLVHFKVENRAMRVDHQWDNSIAYIADEEGNRFENNKEDQIVLDKSLHFGWNEQYNTRFGTSDSTILVFKLPPAVKKPYLKVRGGILMGDVFDRARFRKMKVKLF